MCTFMQHSASWNDEKILIQTFFYHEQEDAAGIMEDYVIKLKGQSSLSADDREDATSNLIAVIGKTMKSNLPIYGLFPS